MTKRVFAMVLALCLVLSMVPVVAVAETAPVTATPKAGTHTNAGHSDDCGLTEGWLPWEKSDSLPTSGQYYLTKNVTLTGEVYLSSSLTLCLNGFVVNTSAAKRLFSTKEGTGITLTITDCTAYTEKDVYYAGCLTGGKDVSAGGGVAFIRRGTTMKLYDGRLTKNTTTVAGGAVALQASSASYTGGKMYMYGGEISNNTAINGTTYKTGGALYLGADCLFEMTGGTISGNKGSGGGALYAIGTNTVNIKNATITGNTASYTGAVLHCANTTVTIQDSDLSGNTCTNATAGGTIRMDSAGGKVILSGKTVIADNTLAAGVGDIMMMKATHKLNVNGLTEGSNVRFCAPNTTVSEASDVITAGSAQTDWDNGWVTFVNKEGAEQRISYNGTAFSFAQGHSHGTSEFIAWDKTDSLPTSGAYYLTKDVTVSKQITLSGSLELCLNGHTVTGYKGRAYNVTGTLNLCSCVSGATVTGFGNNAHGGVIQSSGTVYAENITFTNNDAGTGYGGVLLSTGGTVTFKDCTFHKNTAAQGAAVSVAGTATLTGCSFTENTATASGTLRAVGNPILVENCSFTGNTAKSASAIQTGSTTLLTLKDVTITDNTNTVGYGAVNAQSSIKPIVLQGKVIITGNTANGQPNNLHVQNGTTDGYDVSGLTPGSSIGVSLEEARITAKLMHFTTANESNNPAYFVSDSDSYEVVLNKDNKLTLQIPVPPITHVHCICGKTANPQCDHQNVDFTDWTDPSSLPTEGTWCLTTDVEVTKQTSITGQLTLCLNGHSIKTANRVFHGSTGAKITITDCGTTGTITGATNSAILFAANSTDAELNLWNGSFTDCYLTGGGAAVVIQGETVFNMYGGSFENNWVESKLKLDANGDPILENGSYTAYKCNGGALFVGAGTTFNLYGGSFTGNKATHIEYTNPSAAKPTKAGGQGGAIALYGTANLYGGKIANNEAFLGGGIFVSGSSGNLNLLGTEISGNKAYSAGGVLAMSKAAVNMTAGSVSGNTAGLSGGGIYLSGNAKFTMSGGSVANNSAANNGGGIYLQQAEATITGGTLTGNTAKNLGGGFYITNKGAALTVNNGLITKNEATSGAGIFAYENVVLTINGGKITENKSNSAGGGITAFAHVEFTLNGGSITNNTAKSDGGGMYLLRTKSTLKGATISGNTAANGGGVRIAAGNVTFSGTSITGNKAVGKMTTGSTGQQVKVEGSGGGIYISQAGYKENGVQKSATATVSASGIYVAGNLATSAGGGILVLSKGSRFTMHGSTVTGNEATAGGGGIYFSSNTTNQVNGSTISDNTSLKGGGIFVLSCTADLTDVKITGNSAGSIGGAAFVQSRATLNLENSVVSGNSSKTTGGFYFANPSYGNFKNTELYENTSESAGGAIQTSPNCIVYLQNCTLRNNHSGSSGGAVYNKGRTELENCKVLNNTCDKNGGGLGGNQAGSPLLGDSFGIYATNTVISGNHAAEQGGGVFNHRGNPVYLECCTVTDNTSGMEGSAIYANGRLGLTDTTITGNTSASGGYAVYMLSTEYDGRSYISGHRWLSGNVVIRDNQGGNMYMQEGAIMAVLGESLGEDAYVEITLEKGYLTKQLQGVYGYQLANGIYTVTAGDRSITDPEVYATKNENTQQTQNTAMAGDTILYVVIGVFAALVAAAVAVILVKKKKATKAGKE